MSREFYTTDELIENQSFCRMVNGTAAKEEIEHWSQWIEHSPENREKAQKAIQKISGFRFGDPDFPDIEMQWDRLKRKTVNRNKKRYSGRGSSGRRYSMFIRVAAILLLGSLAGVAFYNYFDIDEPPPHVEQITEENTIVTGEGELKTLSFSNGSRIVLNSNSSLTYTLGLLRYETIKITLNGEAWFDVKNSRKDIPAFAVSTPDGIIRDIGTQFLVTVREGSSRVVLQEGLVEIEQNNSNRINQAGEADIFQVKKGEMVEFDRSSILRRKMVNPTFYSAWATQYMEFDRTSIHDFARYVESRFDVNVKIAGTDLADITLDGAVYFRSLDELVLSVAEVTGIPVYLTKRRCTVYIGKP
ncbi:MAG: FecR domain-containing protein [Balneolaceae bacterium]|nr:FecR domain-containing protein [Balneolaceae bacterium]